MPNSSTHISFKDGTSAAAQPVIETTAPSNTLASMMANWVVVSVPGRGGKCHAEDAEALG